MSTPPFRTLHTFTVTLDKQVTEKTTREENGQRITVETPVTKAVPYTIVLKEPSRNERTDLALFKDVTYGKAITLGLLPKAVMQQVIKANNPKNPLTEDEDKALATIGARLTELSAEYNRLKPAKEGEPLSAEQIERRKEVLVEYLTLAKKAEDLSAAYQSVYASTAETFTQTKMLTWLGLFLTYVKDPEMAADAVPRPLFPGSDYAAKETALNDLDEAKDPLFRKVIDKLPAYWQLYLFGRASTTAEFKAIEEEWAKEEALRAEAEAKQKEQEAAEKAAAAAAAGPETKDQGQGTPSEGQPEAVA